MKAERRMKERDIELTLITMIRCVSDVAEDTTINVLLLGNRFWNSTQEFNLPSHHSWNAGGAWHSSSVAHAQGQQVHEP